MAAAQADPVDRRRHAETTFTFIAKASPSPGGPARSHRHPNCTEYVERAEPTEGGPGQTVNICIASRSPRFVVQVSSTRPAQ